MLSPSDFNNAVPQFTNGNYASNPLNPQYIAEPSSTDYNRGVEPIQTLPAQWWNWFMNKFTTRFNKVNVYVKNIFNELSQLLSLVSETPSGTEGEPTIGQLKDMFETKYPDYLKTAPALSNTYVPQTTKVNGHELCENITITCVACAGANGSGTAFGTAATVNTGTAAGCIPIVGTALGTTNGQFVATDANGCLKPSGYTASCFRASTWTPTCVACAGVAYNLNMSNNTTNVTYVVGRMTGSTVYCTYSTQCLCVGFATRAQTVCRSGYAPAYDFDVALTNGCTTVDGEIIYASATCRLRFCNTTGVLRANIFCGRLCGQAYYSCYSCSADCADNADLAIKAQYSCTAIYLTNALCVHKTSGTSVLAICNKCAADVMLLGNTACSACTCIGVVNQKVGWIIPGRCDLLVGSSFSTSSAISYYMPGLPVEMD